MSTGGASDCYTKTYRISDIASFSYGFTAKAQASGAVRFIRITDISDNGTLNPYDAKYISLNGESKPYLLKKGDILMARTGATYGKTLMMRDDIDAVYASFLIKISLDNNIILNEFYWHFAQSTMYWNQARKLVSTGGQPQFNAGAVGRVLITVPPMNIQREIIAKLDRFNTLCNDLTTGLPAEIAARQAQYEYYRDKLLSFPQAR